MMQFLRRLWSRDQSRHVFTYHDGTRQRRADPLAAVAALEATDPKFAEHLAELDAKEKPDVALPPGVVADEVQAGRKEAVAKLLEATRAAFGLKPLDDTGGLTEAETMGVLAAFIFWMAKAAEDARPFENSQPRASP